MQCAGDLPDKVSEPFARRKSRALNALVEVLKSSELACTICHEGLMESYKLVRSQRRNKNVKFVERAIDRFADAFEKGIEAVADGWERILRVLTEYSCPSSLLEHLIDRIKRFKFKGLQERLLRILDECVFRNDFDRTPRTRISMLTMNCSADVDKDCNDISFTSGLRHGNVKANNILSPVNGHTICFWLRMDGADPDLFQHSIRSYDYKHCATLRRVSVLTIRSNEKPHNVLYRIEIDQGAIRVNVVTRDVHACTEKNILLPNRWHWIVISHCPPEIETQEADCRINICIDNAIYGIAALPYPVRRPEKAPREMADVVFGSKDDWQEGDEEDYEKHMERADVSWSSKNTTPILKQEDYVQVVLGKVAETTLSSGMSQQHVPTLDVGYGAIYTYALTDKEAVELRPESMMMREHVAYGAFPFPHVSNFIIRPAELKDHHSNDTKNWVSNKTGSRIALLHTYSGVESLISLGGSSILFPLLTCDTIPSECAPLVMRILTDAVVCTGEDEDEEDEEENEIMCVDRMALAALHRALPCDALSEELFEETKRFVLKTFCPDSCSDIMSRSKALMLIELGCSLQSNNAEFHRQTFQLLKDSFSDSSDAVKFSESTWPMITTMLLWTLRRLREIETDLPCDEIRWSVVECLDLIVRKRSKRLRHHALAVSNAILDCMNDASIENEDRHIIATCLLNVLRSHGKDKAEEEKKSEDEASWIHVRKEENTKIHVADVLCDLCSKCPVKYFAEIMSQPAVSLQLVGLALMRASLQIRNSKHLTLEEISELETRCFVLSIPVNERVWYSWIEMIKDGGLTTRIVPGFLDALHHPSTTISCRVNCLRRLRRCVLDTSSPRWRVWWWALYGHRNRALQIARIVPSATWTSSLKDSDIAHNQSSSSSSVLGELFKEDAVQNFETAFRRIQDDNVSLEARIECAKSVRYLPRNAKQARLIWDYATNDSENGPSLRLRRALLDTIELSFKPNVVRELVSRECSRFMVAILFQLMVRAEPIREGRKNNPFRFLDCLEIFRVAFQAAHPDISDQVTKSLLESLLLEALRTTQNKPCEVYRVPKLTDLFYASCGQLLAITADECTEKQDTVLELALLLVNPMRDAAPRNKSLFQWKLVESNPIASPRRRATGVMLAVMRMLLRRTLQQLGEGLSVSEDVTSLVTLVRGWDFKQNDKDNNSSEKNDDDETGRGVRLLRWWLSLVLVSVHTKVIKSVDSKEREDVLEQLRDLLQRAIPFAPSSGPVPLSLLAELLRRGDRDSTAMVAKKDLENEENVFRSIRKQFNENVKMTIKKHAKTRESDIATRTETLQVAATQRWDAVHMSSVMWIRLTSNRCLNSLLRRLKKKEEEEEEEGEAKILTVQATAGRTGVGMRRVVISDPYGSKHEGLTHNNFKEKKDWTWEDSVQDSDVRSSTTNTELIGRGIRWSDEYWSLDSNLKSKEQKEAKNKGFTCSDIMSSLRELTKEETTSRKGSGLLSGAFGALSRALKKNKSEEERGQREQDRKENVLTVGKRHFSTKDPSLNGTKWKDFSALERFLQRRDDGNQSGESLSVMENRPQRHGIEAELVVPMLVLEGEISFHSKYFEYRPRRIVKDDRCEGVKIRPLSVMLCLRNGMRRWRYDQIRRVLSRRFMLQRTALEIFFLDGTSVFLNLRDMASAHRLHENLSRRRDMSALFSFDKSRLRLYRPEKLFAIENATQRWIRREISNFDYIMILNEAAGRTYHDITQFPVFPWIVSDFSSSVLDLTDPRSFRNLAKPVGALNAERLEQILERYRSFQDPEIPPFMYGSHYSSVGTVAYYLLRLEPYTSYALSMQGGRFDVADRLFSDVLSTWEGCLKSPSDVKELTPEWFYCPDIFRNINRVQFGKKVNSDMFVNNVSLPKWAKNSPERFVRVLRTALESSYVSSKLHHWIDLIFGYKQQGKAAEDANNVFYHLTYEGAVDFKQISDPVMRKAVETQISHFGQTPTQLFDTPHPKRMDRDEALRFHYPSACERAALVSKTCVRRENVASLATECSGIHFDKTSSVFCICVEGEIVLRFRYEPDSFPAKLVHMNSNSKIGMRSRNSTSVQTALWCRQNANSPSSPSKKSSLTGMMNIFASRNNQDSRGNKSNASVNDAVLFSVGHTDGSLRHGEDSFVCHDQLSWTGSRCTAVAVGELGEMLVTGTSSGIVHVWDLSDKNHEIVKTQTHRFVPRCDEKIVLLDVSDDLGLIVAGTETGNVRLYRARPKPFIFIRDIVKETSRSVRSVRFVNSLGQLLVLCENELRLVNLTQCKTLAVNSSLGRDICPDLLISSDSRFVVVSSDQTIRVLWLHSLEEQRRLESSLPSPATRMSCSSDQRCVFVHSKNGHVYAYSMHLGIGGEVPYSQIDQKQEVKSSDDLLSYAFLDHDDSEKKVVVSKSAADDDVEKSDIDLDGLFGDSNNTSSLSSSSAAKEEPKIIEKNGSDDSDFLRDLFSGY